MSVVTAAHKRKISRGDRQHAVIHLILILGSFIMIFPFVWMILTSLKTNSESLQIPPTLFPETFNTDSYRVVLDELPFGKLYINTLLMMFWRVICAVVFRPWQGLLLQN